MNRKRGRQRQIQKHTIPYLNLFKRVAHGCQLCTLRKNDNLEPLDGVTQEN